MALTPHALRALFPAVQRSTYLNAAASSPLAVPVHQAAVAQLQESLERGDVGFPEWLRRKEDIRARLARLLGASSEEVAFLPSTSIGFHVVGHMLRHLGVREVVTLEQEFPSTTLPLLHQGLSLGVVAPRPDGSYPIDDIERAVTRSTGAIALSAVQYASGFRVDLAAVAELCRARKLYLAINGAQAVGQIPLDVSALKADFLCGTSHKWVMGGYGVGYFFARRELLAQVPPAFAGWLSTPDPMAMDGFSGALRRPATARAFTAVGASFRPDASVLEAGGPSYSALFGFGAALKLLDQVGLTTIERHNAALQQLLRGRLRHLGFRPNAPDDPARGSGICVVKVGGDPKDAVRGLLEEGVVVTPRGGGLRISTHVFNAEEDLERLFAAIAKLGLRPPP